MSKIEKENVNVRNVKKDPFPLCDDGTNSRNNFNCKAI